MPTCKGRPPKQDVSRTERIGLRLTPRELERIEECAKAISGTRTDAIMEGIQLLEAEIKK